MDKELSAVVGAIEKLARSANGVTLANITTSLPGLPTSIPVSFDHRADGDGLQSVKRLLDEYRQHPDRRKGTATVNTLNSFIELTCRQKTEHSVIFAETSWPTPSLTAVINYHEVNPKDGKPAFLDHRIHYPFPLTDEFKKWVGQDGKVMGQGDFAAFIEDRIMEIATATKEEEAEYGKLLQTKFATPSEMMTLSRGLEVTVGGSAKTTVKLSSGETEIAYVEEHTATVAGGQKIVVPGLFMVCVPAFLDGSPVRLPARLRYRKSEGAIAWFFQLYRWKELLRERVVDDLREAVAATKLSAFEGSPER